MKTITIKVPEDLDVRLAKRAKRLGVSKSEIAREALKQNLEDNDSNSLEEEPSAYDGLIDDLGCFESGVGDLSTNPMHMIGFGK